jgi:glycosyltransferase involved in cell wall biosynthesis/SAM-dependent methyltransferase
VRIAWVSPLPPLASGIADYSYELLPFLAEQAEVTVVSPSPGRLRRLKVPPGSALLSPDAWGEHREAFDATFFHLGNNPFHEYVYEAALAWPGVAVFHDFVLHHLLAHTLTEVRPQRDRYEALLREEHGEAGGRLADLRFRGVATDFEKFLFPLSGHVARRARAVVVHSREALDKLRQVAPDVPGTLIPHYAPAPPPQVAGMTREAARAQLGLPQDAFVVGHFGFVTWPKQPAAVVGGFGRLAARHPEALLVFVGAEHLGGKLGPLVEREGVQDRVRQVGFVDLVRFYRYLRAVDVVVNLRYPTAGESSGTVARALAEGRPVIVNDVGSFAELPDEIAGKVQIDGDQTEQVAGHLLRLADDRTLVEAMARAGQSYAATVLDPARCRDLYLTVASWVAAEGASGKAGGAASRSGASAVDLVGGRPAVPAIAGGAGDPRDPAEGMAVHRRAASEIDDLAARALPPSGAGIQLDLFYRFLLGRPAEEHALRQALLSVASGEATARKLFHWLLESREYREVEVIEKELLSVAEHGRPFTVLEKYEYAPDTTERVVEIPWILSRVGGAERLLEIGYAYASGHYLSWLLRLPVPHVHGVDRSTAVVPGLVRTQADVRGLPYREGAFDTILCISTIEHIGLDNSRYGIEEARGVGGDTATLHELERVLAPGGRILISVPFGMPEDHSWFRQYDRARWDALLADTSLEEAEREIYHLLDRGWQPATDLDTVEHLRYGQGAPAARAVLCSVLRKPV